jgi:hypothetical protein
MKTSHDLSNDHIMMIWEWCVEAYVRHGYKLSFPHGTDPVKTYQWRYATAIARQFREWQFDDNTNKYIIDLAVQHQTKAGTLRKGLAAILQGNLLTLCSKHLDKEVADNLSRLDALRHIKSWIEKTCGNTNPIVMMTQRPRRGGYCNLTTWFLAKRISALYLTLSKSCYSVLNRLGADERDLFPKQTSLYLLRLGFINDVGNISQVHDIFGQDWRELCR